MQAGLSCCKGVSAVVVVDCSRGRPARTLNLGPVRRSGSLLWSDRASARVGKPQEAWRGPITSFCGLEGRWQASWLGRACQRTHSSRSSARTATLFCVCVSARARTAVAVGSRERFFAARCCSGSASDGTKGSCCNTSGAIIQPVGWSAGYQISNQVDQQQQDQHQDTTPTTETKGVD